MTSKPEITVAITTFNRPEGLQKAIDSVLAQSFDEFELIIIDDASVDNLEGVLNELTSNARRIRYFKNKKNKGLSHSRNQALQIATGKYIAYLDDDDEWFPMKLEKQFLLATGSAKDCAVISCGARINNIKQHREFTILPNIRGSIRDGILKYGLGTIPSSQLFNCERLRKIGGHDESFLSHVDHAVWMRMAEANYTTDFVPEDLVKITEAPRQRMTADHRLRIKTFIDFIELWLPRWENWYGAKSANEFAADYLSEKMTRQAIYAMDEGQQKAARLYYSEIKKRGFRRNDFIKYWFVKILGSRMKNFCLRTTHRIMKYPK